PPRSPLFPYTTLFRSRDGHILSDNLTKATSQDSQARQFQPGNTGHAARITDVGEAIKMAMRALRANIFRTTLTLLGIIIGVSSVDRKSTRLNSSHVKI